MFNNKTILVTGGTGTFGKAFVKIILKNFKPKKIIVFSRDELKQYEMSQEFSEIKYPNIRYFIGDVRDVDRLNIALRDVNFVIHAAAMKHVNIAEYNPTECISTNIDGARNLITSCINNNVEKLIALSTDKAVNPINLYGATKLASDKLFIAANNLTGKLKTKFSIVRYGNVLNSRGSVVPLFHKYINENKKFLPITDTEMTRFLIKIEDGVNFVFQSLKYMKGGEIFIPKLPSVNIVDLANAIAPNLQKKIIGIRPGEKIHEYLCTNDDSKYTYNFRDFYLISPSIRISNKNIKYNIINNKKGRLVKNNFDYNSKSNNTFLKGEKLLKFLMD